MRDEQSGVKFEVTSSEIVELAFSKVRSAAGAREVRLASTIRTDGTISGRRANLLVLVLRNLLQNAVEAVSPGGVVQLTAGTAVDGRMEFVVEDNGAGLPEEIRRRIFQPCTSTKRGGSGLGLAIGRGFLEASHGTVEASNRTDRGGAVFTIRLPVPAGQKLESAA